MPLPIDFKREGVDIRFNVSHLPQILFLPTNKMIKFILMKRNENSVTKFLNANSFERIIRAHQFAQNGISEHFNKKSITVFSAPSYSFDLGNESGILKINGRDDTIQYIVFEPLHRLPKSKALHCKCTHKNPKSTKVTIITRNTAFESGRKILSTNTLAFFKCSSKQNS